MYNAYSTPHSWPWEDLQMASFIRVSSNGRWGAGITIIGSLSPPAPTETNQQGSAWGPAMHSTFINPAHLVHSPNTPSAIPHSLTHTHTHYSHRLHSWYSPSQYSLGASDVSLFVVMAGDNQVMKRGSLLISPNTYIHLMWAGWGQRANIWTSRCYCTGKHPSPNVAHSVMVPMPLRVRGSADSMEGIKLG